MAKLRFLVRGRKRKPRNVALILEPTIQAARQIGRRDPAKGNALMTALLRCLYILTNTPMP